MIALTVEKQFHQKSKPQERSDLSLPLSELLTLEGYLTYLGITFKKRKFTNFYVIKMLAIALRIT